MEKITINGKRYIGLGDLEHLRHCLVRDIWENNDKEELSDYDRGEIAAYSHIMTKIMEDELEECESPDDVKQLRESIRKEWMEGKFVIDAIDAETNERVFFRNFCGEDCETPAFSTKLRFAREFGNQFHAEWILGLIKKRTSEESGLKWLTVHPMRFFFEKPGEREKRLLNAIFGEDETDAKAEAREKLHMVTRENLDAMERALAVYDQWQDEPEQNEQIAMLEKVHAAIAKADEALARVKSLVHDIEEELAPCEDHSDETRAEDEDWESGADT